MKQTQRPLSKQRILNSTEGKAFKYKDFKPIFWFCRDNSITMNSYRAIATPMKQHIFGGITRLKFGLIESNESHKQKYCWLHFPMSEETQSNQ